MKIVMVILCLLYIVMCAIVLCAILRVVAYFLSVNRLRIYIVLYVWHPHFPLK